MVENKNPEPLLVDIHTAARMLGVGVRTLTRLVASNAIPSVTIGRRRLFRIDSLQRWLDRREVAAGRE